MKKILAAALVMGVAQNGLAADRQEPDTTLHPNTHERDETSMIPLFMCAMLVASYTHTRDVTGASGPANGKP